MQNWSKFLKFFLLLNAILLCISVIPVKPQTAARVSFSTVAKKKKARRTPSNRRRSGSSRREKRTVVVRTKEVVRTVKTSNLTVSSQPGAEVSLQPSTPGAKALVKIVPPEKPENNPEDQTIEFENLTPGKYTVTVSLEGFVSQDTEVIVPKQKTIGISMEMEPIKYELNIDTNVTEGEIRYAPAILIGREADGSPITKDREDSGYCIVPITNGKAEITKLEKGYYNIDVRPFAVEYEPVLTAISLPAEISDENNDDDDDDFEVSYSIDLEKKISTETFASSWINSDWVLPANWSLSNRQMQTSGFDGVALPRNEQYRYYTDFELISDVISADGKSIGFAVRARDAENYYLIQISGANSKDKLIASGSVVKGGISTPLFSIPIDHFASTIEEKKPFRVIIRGQGNKFKIFIEDSETATTREVGDMIDRDQSFKKGAVGIVGGFNSKFTVGSFTVCAKSCM